MSDPDFEEGRYLYCAVDADPAASVEIHGIDDEPVSLIGVDDISLVAHAVDEIYDSDDATTVRRWLLDHQRVVDEAGQRFGTPLPFQFDTIMPGGDDAVLAWLDDHRLAIERALTSLHGRWEYRIGMTWNEDAMRERIAGSDPEAEDIANRVESASDGTAFLLEKQLQRSVSDRLRERRSTLANELIDAIEPHVEEMESTGSGESDTVVEVSVLAESRQEDALGDALERFAKRDDIGIEFTGPWPPYSFAPGIDGDDT